MITSLSDVWSFVKAVGKEMKLFLGTLGITLLRFWKPVFGRDLPNWIFWAANGLSLLFAFFLAWRKEHRAAIDAKSAHLTREEKVLLIRTHKVHEGLLELMRRFPGSGVVLTPFSITWRPNVGTMNVTDDVRQTIDWYNETNPLIGELQKHMNVFPELTSASRFASIQALEFLRRFDEIEAALVRRAVEI
jgi:hypothetical protein